MRSWIIFQMVLLVSASCAFAGDVDSKQSGQTDRAAGTPREDNELKLRLVWCPSGEFVMGSPESEIGPFAPYGKHFENEKQVKVKLTKGFWMGETTVTQSQWKSVMQTGPWSGKMETKEGADYPATDVSLKNAMEFCKKLTDKERASGRIDKTEHYILPTEAQWEYACRAGTKTAYFFGDSSDDLVRHPVLIFG